MMSYNFMVDNHAPPPPPLYKLRPAVPALCVEWTVFWHIFSSVGKPRNIPCLFLIGKTVSRAGNVWGSRSQRCNPIKLLVTTFNNSNNLLGLQFHAYKMNPEPNPNPNCNNPDNLLDTIILLDTTFGAGVWGHQEHVEKKLVLPKCLWIFCKFVSACNNVSEVGKQ